MKNFAKTFTLLLKDYSAIIWDQCLSVYTTHALLFTGARDSATIPKVTGSIPYYVTGIFLLPKPSGRTVALGLTQPLTEMSTRNISWG
jgi:hypothetical protein